MLRIINIDGSVARTAWTLFSHSGYGIMFMDGDPSLVLSIAFHSNQMIESALYLERNGLFHFPEGHGFDRFYIQHLAGSGTFRIGVLEQPSKDRPIYERGGVPKSSPGKLYNASFDELFVKPFTLPLSTTHDLEFLSGYVRFVCSSVAGNRYLVFGFRNSDNEVITVEGSRVVQVASKSFVYNFSKHSRVPAIENLDLNSFGLGVSELVRQPLLRQFDIPAGSHFMLSASGEDIADTISGELFFRKIVL